MSSIWVKSSLLTYCKNEDDGEEELLEIGKNANISNKIANILFVSRRILFSLLNEEEKLITKIKKYKMNNDDSNVPYSSRNFEEELNWFKY